MPALPWPDTSSASPAEPSLAAVQFRVARSSDAGGCALDPRRVAAIHRTRTLERFSVFLARSRSASGSLAGTGALHLAGKANRPCDQPGSHQRLDPTEGSRLGSP